jgi:hypothetical protein
LQNLGITIGEHSLSLLQQACTAFDYDFIQEKKKKTLPTFVDIFPLECKDVSVLSELNEKDRFEP